MSDTKVGEIPLSDDKKNPKPKKPQAKPNNSIPQNQKTQQTLKNAFG